MVTDLVSPSFKEILVGVSFNFLKTVIWIEITLLAFVSLIVIRSSPDLIALIVSDFLSEESVS